MEKKITFVIPGRGRSGGIRSTVILGNKLIEKGFSVRLLTKSPTIYSVNFLKKIYKTILNHFFGFQNNDWVDSFEGNVESYHKLEKLNFHSNELVVAVGSLVVEDIRTLPDNIVKLRYCRGLARLNDDHAREAWKGDIPTISVASSLIDKLYDYGNTNVIGVVPNGKELDLYYDMKLPRDGIGMIYSDHPVKGPKDIIQLVELIQNRWPSLKLHIFGTPKKPKSFPENVYHRYPSIEKVRELYNRCFIWLLPSYDEGLPGPVLEAMACNTIVISTNNYGSLELIKDEYNGFLVEIGSIDGFIQKIDYVLNNIDQCKPIVEQAYQTVLKYNWNNSADEMEKIYNRLILTR